MDSASVFCKYTVVMYDIYWQGNFKTRHNHSTFYLPPALPCVNIFCQNNIKKNLCIEATSLQLLFI